MNKMVEDFRRLKEAFTITTQDMANISENFSRDMLNGLNGRESPLKMLPTFIKSPTGQEKGEFLAVDFGGTNVRILKVALDGRRGFSVLDKAAFPLKDPAGVYDYTSSKVKASSLFDFIVRHVKAIVDDTNSESIFLGHTFSFPCRQKSAGEAVLIRWTKELETAEAEGRDVGQMFAAALNRAGLKSVCPIAIINDTAATLLTAAYQKPGADIASICGTGHNTCYLEPNHPLTNAPMIVNMESGNFDKFPRTIYDQELDKFSEKPSFQFLEKACSGHYLGEIMRLVSQDCFGGSAAPYALNGEDLSLLVSADNREFNVQAGHLAAKLTIISDAAKLDFIRKTACLIIKRSARLVAATFAGTLLYLDPALKNPHVIAIDGSLYEKMPGYAAYIREALDEIFSEKAGQIHLELVKDGSGVGSAIAAAIVCRT